MNPSEIEFASKLTAVCQIADILRKDIDTRFHRSAVVAVQYDQSFWFAGIDAAFLYRSVPAGSIVGHRIGVNVSEDAKFEVSVPVCIIALGEIDRVATDMASYGITVAVRIDGGAFALYGPREPGDTLDHEIGLTKDNFNA